MTSLHADEAFLGHYQFSHDPFAARVPGFRFFPAQRKPVLGQLHHLARYSQLLLVVTGPKGSGKTLLRQALVASTNKQSVLSVVASARGASDAVSIQRQVAQGLGIQQADARSIQAQIAELAITGQEVYLLIDDAEQLADSALDALFSLAIGDGQARAHVFLFAEPELLPRLELLADGEERFHPIELQPYSEDETREYLAQRLDGAGQGIELLSDEQISDIHLTAEGWPGLINQAARDVLVEGMMARRGASTGGARKAGVPKKHVIAAAVVLLALGAAWFMQGRKDATHEETTAAQPPEAASPAKPNEVTDAAKAQEGTAIEFAGSSQPLPLPLVGQAQPVIREPLAQASGMAEGEESGAAASVNPPAVPVVNPTPVTTIAPVAPPVHEVPAVASKPTPAPTVPAKPVAAPVAAKPVPAVKPPAPTVAKAAPAAGMAWYAAQPGASFALQILGTRSESAAQAFVSKNGGEYRYFKKLLQGQPLYVVTYGSFSSRTAAQAAIKTLPASVQAGKPWPRTFASIKQEAAQVR